MPATPPVTPTPDQNSARDPQVEALAALGEACLRNTGDELGFIDTTSGARDIERIRIALRESAISYIAYSYGTFLGTQYADLYPSSVRAFVLDGGVDPALSAKAQVEGQAVAAERSLQAFLSDCAVRPACSLYNNGDPGVRFDELRRALDIRPLLVPATSGDSTRIDGTKFVDAVYQALIRGAWNTLAQALADVQIRQDGTAIVKLLQSGSGAARGITTAAATIATNCLDAPTPNRDALSQLAERLRAEAPHFVSPSALTTCDGWPFEATRQPHELHAVGSAPILVIGTTGDPLAPYEWSQSLARQLRAGHLLTWQGHRHTVSFHSPSLSQCIDAAVTAYLVDLVLPSDGTVCE